MGARRLSFLGMGWHGVIRGRLRWWAALLANRLLSPICWSELGWWALGPDERTVREVITAARAKAPECIAESQAAEPGASCWCRKYMRSDEREAAH